jgi:hypothetical protein
LWLFIATSPDVASFAAIVFSGATCKLGVEVGLVTTIDESAELTLVTVPVPLTVAHLTPNV